MKRIVLLYGAVLAAAAFALEWLQYKYVAKVYAAEFYILLIAAGFMALGVWAGRRLTGGSPSRPFEKNVAALASLGVTEREYEVLTLLAEGCANKEIARRLSLSPNTIKTHVARIYEKLEVGRRTEAVRKARELALLP